MARFYNITSYKEAGEPWSMPGRGEFQTFFIDIEGVDGTITTNKKKGNTPKVGQNYGTLEDQMKTGKNGQKIYKFKGELAPDGVKPTASTSATTTSNSTIAPTTERGSTVPEWFAPYAVMIKQIYEDTKAGRLGNYIGSEADEPKLEEPFPSEPEKVAGTDLTPEELSDIFGGSVEPIELED